jgi:hypothetical protein
VVSLRSTTGYKLSSLRDVWTRHSPRNAKGLPDISRRPGEARDLARKVIPHDAAALQWSLSGGGLTDSPVAELEKLFQEAVARHYDSVDDEQSRLARAGGGG